VPQALDKVPKSHTHEKHQVTGERYYLYVPSSYDPQKKYPLVITLHGTPYWDTAWQQIYEWRSLAEKRNFIVAAPKLDSTQGILPVIESFWMKNLQDDERTILALREELCSRFSINTDRILLTGFSAGGYPMYYTGLRNPDKFHMLIARACNSDQRIFDSIDLKADYKRIPIVIFVGKDDLSPIMDQSWAAFRWLRRHGWNRKNSRLKQLKGGHLRRPETCHDFWSP